MYTNTLLGIGISSSSCVYGVFDRSVIRRLHTFISIWAGGFLRLLENPINSTSTRKSYNRLRDIFECATQHKYSCLKTLLLNGLTTEKYHFK